MAGTFFGPEGEGRITTIDGFRLEALPLGQLLVIYSHDVPGVIGYIGGLLGKHGINISSFNLGREARGGREMSVVETDTAVSENVLADLGSFEQVYSVTVHRPSDLTARITDSRLFVADQRSAFKIVFSYPVPLLLRSPVRPEQ